MAAVFLTAATEKVAENLVAPIGRELDYLFNCHSYFDGLKERAEKLGDARGRLQRCVDEADRQGDEIFPDVRRWLLRAEEMIQKAEKFIEDEKRTNKGCFNGWRPNLKSRYQLGKEAKKLDDHVVKIQKANNFDRVSYRPPPPGILSATLESRMHISVASKAGEDLGSLIGGQLGYLFHYHSNITGLMEQIEKLGDARWRLLLSVDEACSQGNEIFPDVQRWLFRAEEMIRKSEKFIEDEKRTNNKRCFNGWCPNLKSRYQLSKEAKKLAGHVVKIQEANNFDRVSYRPPPPGIGSAALESRIQISIALNAAEDLGSLIRGQLGYLFHYHSNIAGLMEQVEKLGDARRRLLLSVDEAYRQGNGIFPDVRRWLLRAEEMIQKAEKFIEDETRTNKGCFNGWCPNLEARYQLSKEAKKLASHVVKIQEANKFDRVSYLPPPSGIGSEALESRMQISLASKAGEDLGSPIGGQLGCLFHHHSNIAGLMEQVEKLGDARWRLLQSVDEACSQGNEIFPDVQKWLLHAEETIQKAEKFIEDEKRTNKRCFNGRCPNLKSRYQLSKEAKKQADDIAVRIHEAYNFGRVSYRPPPQGLGAASFQGYEALESRMWFLNNIMDALRDAELNMIGIWGMGGVGKTILAKQVASQALEEKLFNKVVIAQVSLTPRLMQIQEQIASMLGLQLEQENESLRASRLYDRLKKEENILIILDDIWAELDLRKVGIPCEDDHRGCKIVLTSRDLFVLSNEMGTQRNFLVEHLSEEEAWRLFKKTAGDPIERPDLRSIAIEVAKGCVGLPIAIVTIAETLKQEDPIIWKETLQQLRRSIMTNIEEFSDKLYSTVKLSYIHLNSDEIKSLFLLCALIANHVGTDDLLKYVIGLALFEGINTLEEATNRLHSLFHDLRAASLLLDCEDGKCVRMHDVVRDIAIEIATKEHHWLVREGVPSEEWSKTDEQEIATEDHHRLEREGVRLEEWSKTDEPEECTCISLNSRHIHELPEWLVCPKLKIFRLFGKDPSLNIRSTFFEGMKELEVLDLSGMHFLSLPPSLGFLKNLRTLHLLQCALGDVAMIGELKKLEVLSLVQSNIEQLPKELAQLTRLRLLDLRNCSQLKVIPSNVISKLSQLEKLCMENSFTQWEAEGFVDQKGNACVAELKFLSELIILDVKIPDASLLPKDVLFENLTRYRIFIGDVWDWYGNSETSRTLRLNKFDTGLHLVDGISRLLKRTEDLCLRELSGTKNLLNLDREGFLELQYLHVQSSAEIQFIINSVEWFPSVGVFPVLKSLLLDNLIHLEDLCHGRLPVGSFCNLRFLTVENCPILSNVIPCNLLQGIQNLEVLNVKACTLLEVVFNFEGLDTHSGHVGMLPKLKELNLIDLPKLKHICNKGLPRIEEITQEGAEEAVDMIEFPELISISLESLPNLASFYRGSHDLERLDSEDLHIPNPMLFNEKVSFPNLEILKLSGLFKLMGIWDRQLPLGSFCNLRILEVEKCPFLLHVVPKYLIASLQNLEKLNVEKCDQLQEVFDLEGLDNADYEHADDEHADDEHARMHSKLEELKLIDLPKLRYIWNKDLQQSLCFQNLKLLHVKQCGSLTHLFSSGMALDLERLKDLCVEHCSMIKEIIMVEDRVADKIIFPQTTQLSLLSLPNLTSFYRGTRTHEKVHMEDCDILACVLFHEKVAFPNLEFLYVSGLDNVKKIWHNKLLADSFSKLKETRVENCKELLNISSSNVMNWLPSLEFLRIASCGKLTEVFDLEVMNVQEDVRDNRLGRLVLDDLQNLEHICNKVLGKQLCLQNLRFLEVHNCGSVKRLFSPYTELEGVKEIIGQEEGAEEVTDKIEFPELTSLSLKSLPSLASFYPGSHTLKMVGPGDHDILITVLFHEKVAFPCLEDLDISNLDGVEKIWHNEFVADSFGKLKRLSVWSCNKLRNIIPSNMLKRLLSLQILKIVDSNSVEEIFDLESIDSEEHNDIPTLQLRELCLDNLETLKCVWNKAPQGLLTYQNLKSIRVSHCPSLKTPFPGYVVRSLLQVKEVDMNSHRVKEIVAHEDMAKGVSMFLFPEVTSLTNSCLKELKCFYLGLDNLEWPMLKRLEVESCESLEMLASELDKPVEQPIFLCVKVAFPNLEVLNLCLKLKEIQDLHVLFGALSNLKILIVENCPYLLSLFSPQFIRCLNNLKELTVKNCDLLEELFDLKGLDHGDVEHVEMHSQLEEVSLIDLPMLRYICNNSPRQVLCFRNLKLLQVKRCQGMTHLFSPSMVLGLVQLQDLCIEHCDKMKEIVTAKEGVTDKIIFPQITHVSLLKLPNLTCFYPSQSLEKIHMGDSNSAPGVLFNEKVNFPKLKILYVSGLDNVKKIWHHQLLADSFGELKETKVENCKELLNISSSNVMNWLPSLEFLRIASCGKLTEVFDLEVMNVQEDVRDNRLGRLVLDVLQNLEHICNKVLGKKLCLQNLRFLEVHNCGRVKKLFSPYTELEGVKEIIRQEEGAEEVIDKIKFPELASLSLKSLPSLASFYPGRVGLGDRGILITVLFDEKVAFPKLEILYVSGLDNVKKIWHHQLLADSFGKLKETRVENCKELLSISSSNVMNWLPSLEFLRIASCGKLTEVFDLEVMNVQEDVRDNRLGRLVLDDLQNLEHICNKVRGKKLCLQNLRFLKVHNCGRVKKLFSPYTELEGVKEIIGQEEGAEEVIDKIEFPELTSLSLESLPSLASFYPGRVGPGDHGILITVLFDEMVAFPSLSSLHISGLDNINEIWNNKRTANSFSRLEKPIVLKWLSSLQFLRIANCGKLKEVFDLEGANILDDATETQLNKLELHDLPQLQYIWNRDPYGILTFQNLDLVEVLRCQVLKGQFPSCLTRDLSQLEKQLIRSRWKKDLDGKEKGEDFVFPEVTYDKLLDLRKTKGKEVVVVSESDYVGEISEDMPGSSG